MSSPIASSSSSNTHSPPSEDASSSLPPPIPSTSSDGTSTSTSLLSGSTLPQPKKNRNKKSLVLGAAAAKPGTLSGLEGGSLLAGTANTGTGTGVGVPHARPPPRRPAPIQVSARRGPSSLPTTPTPAASSSSSEYHNKLSEQLATLELGVEFKLDLREEDLTRVEELGAGNGGTVERVKHGPTGIMMAKKASDRRPACRPLSPSGGRLGAFGVGHSLPLERTLTFFPFALISHLSPSILLLRQSTSRLPSPSASKSSGNFKSCTIAIRPGSSDSTAPTCWRAAWCF